MRGFWVAIPTYWTHPGAGGPEEVIFDHPTPLDAPGTLRRTLESLSPLVREGMQVGVVAAATAPSLAAQVEERVQEVINSPPLPYPVVFFSPSHLKALQDFVHQQGKGEWLFLLSLSGYAQIRNLTLLLANIWDAQVLVSLDDDEVIADPDFFAKIEEDFASLGGKYPVFGLAGVYRDAKGGVLLPEPDAPWTTYWPKFRWLNAALTELALAGPRLKPTPLGFGGNLALSAALFRQIPFDPAITRGEDVDYVLNARLFKIPFFLDNTLSIVHLPPDKPHPTWLRLRQDLVRFSYMRQKLRQQELRPDLALITPAELKPYPGNFLEDDLEMRAYQSHTLLAREYLAAGDPEAARQTLANLVLMHQVIHSGQSVFQEYLHTVARWRALQQWLAQPEVAARARRAIWG
jgi:hypothetical protein